MFFKVQILKSSKKEDLIMEIIVNDQVVRAQEIKHFLDQLRIGHNGATDCRCIVGPEPFWISQEDHIKLTKQGELFRQWFEITNQLCLKACRDPKFHWLAEIIEGGINADAIKIHRRAYLENIVSLPVLARADMVDIGSTAEVQIPGSGWGYMTAIYSTTSNNSKFIGPVQGFAQAMKSVTGSSQTPAAYILYNGPFYREVQYFCDRCQREGIPLTIYFKNVPRPDEARFIRRPPLEDLVQYPGANEIIQAHFRGELTIEPDLSLLYDQKIATAFPFDPRLQNEYTNEIRGLFPETYLIQEEINPCFGGKTFTWEKIISLSRKERQFIVKYGGAKKGMRAGGKAVFNLSDCNLEHTKQIITSALIDWRDNHNAWLIQRRVNKKFNVTFLDPESQTIVTKPYYALFRPMYLFPRDNTDPFIITHCALFRKEWKVHGSSDAVNLPVEITPE
jgi:hypothetical protein